MNRSVILVSISQQWHSLSQGSFVCAHVVTSVICLSTWKENGCWLPSAEKYYFEDALGLIGLVGGWKSWLEKHTERRILKDTSPSLLETLQLGFCHCQRCSSRRSSYIFWEKNAGHLFLVCSWIQAGARIPERQCTGPSIMGLGQAFLNVFPHLLVLWGDSSNLGFCDGKWQSEFHQDWIYLERTPTP